MTKAEKNLLAILTALTDRLGRQFKKRKESEIANVLEIAKILDRLKDLPDIDIGLQDPGRGFITACSFGTGWIPGPPGDPKPRTQPRKRG